MCSRIVRASKPRRRRPVRFVVCIENSGYPASLELHKIYRAVPDQDATREGDLRIVDESGEDYLYPAEWFAAVEVPRRVRTSLLRRPARLCRWNALLSVDLKPSDGTF
jgi:hypothetical protein